MGDRYTGIVKWFNPRTGYGFVTINDGSAINGKDIFAHYSALVVAEGIRNRYLVQGEYVQLCTEKPDTGSHEFISKEITGINRGLLMCETRANKVASSDEQQEPQKRYRTRRNRPRKDGPPSDDPQSAAEAEVEPSE